MNGTVIKIVGRKVQACYEKVMAGKASKFVGIKCDNFQFNYKGESFG